MERGLNMEKYAIFTGYATLSFFVWTDGHLGIRRRDILTTDWTERGDVSR